MVRRQFRRVRGGQGSPAWRGGGEAWVPCLREESPVVAIRPQLAQALNEQAAIVAGLHLEIGYCPDEVGQARETVIPRGEAGNCLGALAEFREGGEALFVALGR